MEYNLIEDVLLRKIVIILILLTVIGCDNIKEKQTFSFLALNTTCTISILNSPVIDMNIIKDLIDHIENLMSSHIVSSDISQINKLAGVDFYKPDSKTLDIIREGIKYGDLSNGDFDISIGPLVSLWDINNQSRVVPDNEISSILHLIDYKKIIIKNNSVKLSSPGMALDLGGIAKGYAASVVKEFLINNGVTSAIINLGGNIDLIGTKPDGSLWNIGIQHPRKERGQYIGILSVNDSSLVSSGDYERFFIKDGIRYHHILNSDNGFPKNGDIISSSILVDDSVKGDALSTITFGQSISEIEKLRDKIKFEGIFITRDKSIYLTSGVKEIFTLKDETYKILP